MPSELRPLRKPLGLRPSPELGAGLLAGEFGDVEVVAAIGGVGMRAGARCAEHLLDATFPDHLVIVGIAGGIGPDVAVGDVVVPDVVSNLDTGATYRPASLGLFERHGTLASSDALLESPEAAMRLFDRGVVAVDMESAAVADVCERRGCRWSVFRAISDRADDGSTDAAILELVEADGRPKPMAALRFALTRPQRIPHLLRLARGANLATRAAAGAAIAALQSASAESPRA